MDEYILPNCNIIWYNILLGKKASSTTALKVDGRCNNFVWGPDKKTVWYKAVKTTDKTQYRPGTEPQLKDTAVCKNNKLENSGVLNGKRCIQWENKPMVCSDMGYETGIYFRRSRLASDNAPNSNRCKKNCIDKGDIFCVNKNDLES